MRLRRVPTKHWNFLEGELLGFFDLKSFFSTVIAIVKWKSMLIDSIESPYLIGTFKQTNRDWFVWLYKTHVWISSRQVTHADFISKSQTIRYKTPKIQDVLASLTPSLITTEPSTQVQDNRYIPQWVKIIVVQRDGGRCVYCFESDPALLEFDHRKSWVKGGSSKDPNNICLGCRTCNRKKGAKDWGWG